jgi:Mrp family chromosome partitioning ATPase
VLISAFAGIVAATLAAIVVLLLAYFDGSLHSPEVFRQHVPNLPLLGAVGAVPTRGLRFQNVFSSNGDMPQYAAFRESLRSLRAQLMSSGEKVFLFVSTKTGEGKTFSMLALAHSLAANNKKVLILDTNFKTPLQANAATTSANADLLRKLIREHGLEAVFEAPDAGKDSAAAVDVVRNTGLHRSPSEMFAPERFEAFLDGLRAHYDFLFLEAPALNAYADARELAPFVDKVIAVFNAGSTLKPIDRASMAYLHDLDGRFAGSVLTQVDERNMY